MGFKTYVDQDESDVSIDITKYRGMTGSLLYLTINRPDIMFSVCLYARFQANPKESHHTVVKRIMKYLKGTTNVGLWYPKCSICDLVGYSDSNNAGLLETRKSLKEDCSLNELSDKSKRIVLGVLVKVCIERLGCLVHKI
ncbi:uncharacterized mitochondrial protein AtMg00240-like [Lathyrus oleraceus]|uniref:uncharacterized mitochondrial protein AtMg00240-like n=1 Tax=Pisum sativum TaxID=3888 RepID=UPI0021D0AEF8|nr:uncharacterized mitochondrial protein AtMg00240-like [Pisum sativum]